MNDEIIFINPNEDYRTKGFHKKETFDNKGFLTKIEFYKEYDFTTDTYTNLMVDETREFVRDLNTGIPFKRVSTILLYDGNGHLMTTKIHEKYYTLIQGMSANELARKNVVNKAILYLLFTIGDEPTQTLSAEFMPSLQAYYLSNIAPLINTITNSVNPYLTSEIKTILLDMLNFTYA
jgi:hypothetical protein